jgi:hypothetical protein
VPLQKTIGGVTKPEVVPSLIVLNAQGVSLQGNKLVLTGVAPNSIVFADRPVRAAGHDTTSHIIEDWAVGTDNFAKDPRTQRYRLSARMVLQFATPWSC